MGSIVGIALVRVMIQLLLQQLLSRSQKLFQQPPVKLPLLPKLPPPLKLQLPPSSQSQSLFQKGQRTSDQHLFQNARQVDCSLLWVTAVNSTYAPTEYVSTSSASPVLLSIPYQKIAI